MFWVDLNLVKSSATSMVTSGWQKKVLQVRGRCIVLQKVLGLSKWNYPIDIKTNHWQTEHFDQMVSISKFAAETPVISVALVALCIKSYLSLQRIIVDCKYSILELLSVSTKKISLSKKTAMIQSSFWQNCVSFACPCNRFKQCLFFIWQIFHYSLKSYLQGRFPHHFIIQFFSCYSRQTSCWLGSNQSCSGG